MLSLDDELFTRYESRGFIRAKRRAQRHGDVELTASWVRWFRRAQRFHEVLHRRERSKLLRIERERQKAFREVGLDPVLEAIE